LSSMKKFPPPELPNSTGDAVVWCLWSGCTTGFRRPGPALAMIKYKDCMPVENLTVTPEQEKSAPNEPRPQTPVKVGFVSLGCPKNLVDSEVMMGMLQTGGATITSRADDADVIVVNTCSFIDSAKQESVNTILEMAQHKVSGRAKKLVVAGCLVERYRDEIQKNIPEVDAVVGTGELEHILAAAGIETGFRP